ncbi:MAG: glycosyltransferase family 2 protein [Patescibacteria group bacterium]
MTLALQLLTYRRTDVLPALFESLRAQTDKDWTLYHLDNSTNENERIAIQSYFKSVGSDIPIVTITGKDNLGFAGGHETLFRENNADLVLLLNDDAILEPTYIETLRQFIVSHEKVAAVEGAVMRWVLDQNGGPKKTDIIDTLGFSRSRSGRVSDISSGRPACEFVDKFLRDEKVFGVSGCLPMYRRAAVESLSDGRLFDPAYTSYKEDVDLAYRLNKNGWEARVVPSAVAYHLRGFDSSRKNRGCSVFAESLSLANHWRNLRHTTTAEWLHDGWAIAVFEAAKVLYFIFTKPTVLPRAVSAFFKK